MSNCVFCQIVAGEVEARVVRRWPGVLAIVPRSPVVDGHLLVLPTAHVRDVGTDPSISAATMAAAAELAGELPAANVITSRGAAATQSVWHLHLHVVPRKAGDCLPLPWTIRVVYAGEPVPAGPSLFLAGPTPRAANVASWRPEALAAIRTAWSGGPLNVLVPEPRNGVWAADYTQQYDWEYDAMEGATVIAFWIPRCMSTFPGLTTNIEWGRYCDSGRVVLGAPPQAPDARRNRYLIHQAQRYGVPVTTTLAATIQTALDLAARRRL